MSMVQAHTATQERAAKADGDLLAALAGTQANHQSAVAARTRRVVSASWGQMQATRAGRKRNLAVALAVVLVVVLGLGPFVWRVVNDLIGGEHMMDVPTQFSLLICIFCPAIVAAVVVAGWVRRRS